jgi:hypothetical protein
MTLRFLYIGTEDGTCGHRAEPARIAAVGFERCHRDGYSNVERLAKVSTYVACSSPAPRADCT